MRTRATVVSGTDQIAHEANPSQEAMEISAQSLLKLLILPKDVSSNGRICTLAHPRTANPSRYYFCPQKGIFEFTKIMAPKSTRQSWLIGPQKRSSLLDSKPDDRNGISVVDSAPSQSSVTEQPGEQNKVSRPVSDGYVAEIPELLIATPIDPLFLILPSLCTPFPSAKSSPRNTLFLSSEDLFENLQLNSKHLDLLSRNNRLRQIMQERMKAVCDIVEGGGEDMYRLNQDKLLKELVSKAEKVIAFGLPLSMEEKLVQNVLAEPLMGIKRNENSFSESANLSQDEVVVPEWPSSGCLDPRSSLNLSETSISEISSKNLPILSTKLSPTEDVIALLRLRTALLYIISSYLPQSLEAEMRLLLASSTTLVNFKLLDEHLAYLSRLRVEDAASRSLSNFSRKRNRDEDDDAAELRAEKKKLKEDEERRKKAGESRGVRDLKKVDTSGMKKMSDFFSKGAAPKKK